MQIGDIPLGDESPLVLIAGLNVIEGEAEALATAEVVRELAARHGFPLVFKASVDKANRSHLGSYRGPGFDEGTFSVDFKGVEMADGSKGNVTLTKGEFRTRRQ